MTYLDRTFPDKYGERATKYTLLKLIYSRQEIDTSSLFMIPSISKGIKVIYNIFKVRKILS